MASKKITELTADTAIAANSILVFVDPTGPTTKRITVTDFCNSIPAVIKFAANVSLLANTVVGNGFYFTTNNLVIIKNSTPSSTTDVASAPGGIGQIWSDGSYIYVRANTTHMRRVAIATW